MIPCRVSIFIFVFMPIFMPIYISSRRAYTQRNMKTKMKIKMSSEGAQAGPFVRGSERRHQVKPGALKLDNYAPNNDS